MKRRVLTIITNMLPSRPVFAHCDVPCGIYDPKPAQIAAATVLKMVTLIDELPKENPSVEERAKFVRCVMTKEEHAQKCKQELLILWTDYFKPEHVKLFPNLHELFWGAAKLCSQNKQHVDKKLAEQLIKTVDDIARIFAESKAAK